MESNAVNLGTIFLTGLFTGGLTCLAVQGGLLATTIAQREEEKLQSGLTRSGNALPIFSFLTTKLVAYTILGFLLGALGSVVQLSLTAKVMLQFAVVIFMLGTALNLLEAHPIFRYFVIQPPKFLTRLVRKQSKSSELFAPAILGAFTVFIPCGTTQAMMALAIASGNPLLGATVLFTFIIATSPLFFILGYFATKLGDALHEKFMKVAALALIALAAFNFYGVLSLAGFNVSFGSNTPQTIHQTTTDSPTIHIAQTGYVPGSITVKAGHSISLKIVNEGGTGCEQAFTIPSMGIQRVVTTGKSDLIQFTAPERPTQIPFMCSMGMFRGVINVI